MVKTWGAFIESGEAVRVESEPIASLGDRLALSRIRVAMAGAELRRMSLGEFEIDELTVATVDEHGRLVQIVGYPARRLGDALVALYERYAELVGAEDRARATVTAASLKAMYGAPHSVDVLRAALHADVVTIDHRPGAPPPSRGAGALLRSTFDGAGVGSDIVVRVDDVLAAEPDRVVLLVSVVGRTSDEGGQFEVPSIRYITCGPDGLVTRTERFGSDQIDLMWARFDAREADAPSNAATRTIDRLAAAVRAGDWDTVAALHAPDTQTDDRRSVVSAGVVGRDATL
jgi:hypothetical protein